MSLRHAVTRPSAVLVALLLASVVLAACNNFGVSGGVGDLPDTRTALLVADSTVILTFEIPEPEPAVMSWDPASVSVLAWAQPLLSGREGTRLQMLPMEEKSRSGRNVTLEFGAPRDTLIYVGIRMSDRPAYGVLVHTNPEGATTTLAPATLWAEETLGSLLLDQLPTLRAHWQQLLAGSDGAGHRSALRTGRSIIDRIKDLIQSEPAQILKDGARAVHSTRKREIDRPCPGLNDQVVQACRDCVTSSGLPDIPDDVWQRCELPEGYFVQASSAWKWLNIFTMCTNCAVATAGWVIFEHLYNGVKQDPSWPTVNNPPSPGGDPNCPPPRSMILTPLGYRCT